MQFEKSLCEQGDQNVMQYSFRSCVVVLLETFANECDQMVRYILGTLLFVVFNFLVAFHDIYRQILSASLHIVLQSRNNINSKNSKNSK